MEIILNNKKEVLENKDSISVQEFLEYKNFTYKMLVVKLNNKTIKKELYEKVQIQNGDNVTVIHLIAGG